MIPICSAGAGSTLARRVRTVSDECTALTKELIPPQPAWLTTRAIGTVLRLLVERWAPAVPKRLTQLRGQLLQQRWLSSAGNVHILKIIIRLPGCGARNVLPVVIKLAWPKLARSDTNMKVRRRTRRAAHG